MPFKVLTLDGELLVEEEKDLERRFKEKHWTRAQKIKANKRRCWRRHSDEYNARRKARNSSIGGKYNASKRKALSVGQKWELTQEEWQELWISAGFMVIPGTITPSDPRGMRMTAFALRGPNRHNNTYMTRKDLGAPWSKDNCFIGFRGAPIEESPYHVSTS